MTPEQWGRVKVVFEEAMEVAPERRADFVAQACADDPGLKQEVQAMVENASLETTFLESSYQDHILVRLPEAYEPSFHNGECLSGRYRVVRFIGKGGMGEVYEAEDSELGTNVALKTIGAELMTTPGLLDRFKREVQLARKVTHPNVCRVFDLGHHAHPQRGDVIFLTMELLDGETLAERLQRQGPVPAGDALPLIRQMVAGLAAAHQLGIIHRDFKPGNVMLLRGTSPEVVKVTDFGLARSTESDETWLTLRGEVVGTPDFMAPEQFSGKSSVETDVFAMGLVVCVMLTGALPVNRAAAFAKTDPKSGDPQTKVPRRWQAVLQKCLATHPADRFHGAEEFWRALSGEGGKGNGLATAGRRFQIPAAVVLAMLLGWAGLVWRGVLPTPFHRLPEQKHLAVLRFKNIGNDPNDQRFADGMVETLTSDLSQLERYQKSFWIVPSSDARDVASLDDAYRKLNVTLAVTGSVQHTDNGLVLITNLVDAKNHKQLASRTLHATSADMNKLQSEVWESVADMVDLQVSPEVARLVNAGGTKQPGAFELYEQGVGYLQRLDHESIDNAIKVFSTAIDKDPNYALAYAGLGRAYSHKYLLAKDPKWITKAVWNGRRAVELDNASAPAHVALGEVYVRTGQLDTALSELQLALQLDPAAFDAEFHIGEAFEAQGKFDEAEAAYKSLVNRRPGFPVGFSGLGTFYYRHGQFQRAADQFQAMIDLQPDNFLAYEDLAGVDIAMARYEEAVGVLTKELAHKQTSSAWTNLGNAYMYLKRYPEAADAMLKATQLDPHNDILWRNLGDSYRQIPSRAADATLAYQKALQCATDELTVNPNDTEVLSGIALYHAHLGHKREAGLYISKALQLSPKNSDVLFTSALVYEIIGHRDKALDALAKAFDAGYSLADIEGEPELAGLRADIRYQHWLRLKKSALIVSHNLSDQEVLNEAGSRKV